jgi:hypothetical protein
MILEEQVGGVEWTQLAEGRASSCEHGNDPTGSTKVVGFVD